MGIIKLLFGLIILSLNYTLAQDSTENYINSSKLEGPYLGQKPPGLIPEIFAPGIVSTENYEYGGVFTPDLKEFYFIANGDQYEKPTFVFFQNHNNDGWVKKVLSTRVGQPMFSSDGKKMYLGKHYMERTETGWSEVKTLRAPFEDQFIMRLSVAANGTCYFDTYVEDDPEFPIRYSRLIGGRYEEPRALDKAINYGSQLNHPFIAPDESYLIWDAKREDGFGDSDLYISFKQEDGSWGNAINFGDTINTEAWEAAATISPDGKYLFFNRNMGSKNYENVDIFWVDAHIIEKLRPK